MPQRLFICSSTRDTSIAEFLHSELEKRGADVFIASRNLKPGVNLRAQIEAQLVSRETILVMVSTATIESAWVRQVIDFASDHHKRLIALLLDDTHDPDIPHSAERLRFSQSIACVEHVCQMLGITPLLDLSWIANDSDTSLGSPLLFEFDDLFLSLTDIPLTEKAPVQPSPVIDFFASMDEFIFNTPDPPNE